MPWAEKARRGCRPLFAFFLLALLVGGSPSGASAQVRLTLDDVDIHVFIKLISDLTGRTFVVDDRVKAKITVISPEEVTREEAYRIFLAVLEVKGFSTIPTPEGIIKIIPSTDAPRSNPPTVFEERRAVRFENFMTQVIPLKYLKVDQIEPVISAMTSPAGQAVVIRRNNSFVVSDYRSNIDRIIEVLGVFDRQGFADHVEVIPLRYSPVEAVTRVLGELRREVVTTVRPEAAPPPPPRPRRPPTPPRAARPAVAGDESPVTIVADERINAVVLMGPPALLEEMKALVARLDVPATSLKRNFYVHPLKHASAEELLPVLREIVAGVAEARPERRPPRPPGAAPPPTPTPGVAPARVVSEEEALRTALRAEVGIVADKGTNTLVITATSQDYEALKPVIEKLDIQRRQVLIEAIIAEITVTRARELGFDFQTAKGVDGGLLIGRSSVSGNLPTLVPSVAGAAAGSIASFFGLSGLAALAVSGETVTTPDGTRVPAHLLLFRAIESDSDIDILSRPSILTRDNQEAEIVVGANVPFIVAQQADRTDPNSVFSQIERRDIGVILRITPQVTEGDFIKLNIFQEISAIQPVPANFDVNIQGLVLRKRSARTSISVKDQQLIAIGGLISDDTTESTTGIPVLSRIPFVGQLFRFDTRRREKTNLLILLTPRVVRDKEAEQLVKLEDLQEILSPPFESLEVPPGQK